MSKQICVMGGTNLNLHVSLEGGTKDLQAANL